VGRVAKRVLIIDDSMLSRRILGEILMDGGYEVAGEAGDGFQGLNEYKRLLPDLVTIDYMMPIMNGLEAAKAILEYDHKAKIIMCTSLGSRFKKEEAARIGIQAFIVKPVKKEMVLETVDKTLHA
jgi:two-component system chemotaxis response regulator CheY